MPVAPPFSISFVVVNKDDPGLADTLEALDRIAADCPWSVDTVVVDASADRMEDLRRRFPRVRWCSFRPRSDKATIAEQRNLGVARCRGDVVIFIDASCVPDPGWLPTLVAPIIEDGEVLVAGSGRSRGPAGIRDEARHFLGDARYIREAPTLNLAVAKRVLTRIGPFDETFDYGSDIDFTWRAVDAGYRVRYAPEAVVAHEWGTTRSEMCRSFRYGRARYRLYAKHPLRRRSILRHEPETVAYPLFLVVVPFIPLFPWLAALLAIPLAKNVRHHPVSTVVHHLVYAAGILAEATKGYRPGSWPARGR